MKHPKKTQSLTKQVRELRQKTTLNDHSVGAIADYNELLEKGIIVKKPYYVDFSGFRQVREQLAEQTGIQ